MLATWLVVMQHVTLHALFAIDPYKPGLIDVPELWAMNRKWQFYLLIAVVAGSLSMTLAAWRLRAPVRLTLTVSWAIFLGLMMTLHAERMQVMIQLMIEHG